MASLKNGIVLTFLLILLTSCSHLSQPIVTPDQGGGVWIVRPWGIYFCENKGVSPNCKSAEEVNRGILGERK